MPLSHLAGLALLAGLVPLSFHVPPLALAAAATLVLVVVAAWETRSLAGQIRALAGQDVIDAR
jgi:low temperature requirement protein LtrA